MHVARNNYMRFSNLSWAPWFLEVHHACVDGRWRSDPVGWLYLILDGVLIVPTEVKMYDCLSLWKLSLWIWEFFPLFVYLESKEMPALQKY